jgi:hypothetical protein
VWLEGLGKLKKFNDLSGSLVEQCLNQLRYRMPQQATAY